VFTAFRFVLHKIDDGVSRSITVVGPVFLKVRAEVCLSLGLVLERREVSHKPLL